MAAVAPNSSSGSSDRTSTISAAVCVALAMVILVAYCIARRIGVLETIRETTRTRSQSHGSQGLDVDIITSFPITKYDGNGDGDSTGKGQIQKLANASDHLEAIPEPRRKIHSTNETKSWSSRLGHHLQKWRYRISRQQFQRSKPNLPSPPEECRTCAICTEDFADGASLRPLPCRHIYHVRCIDSWLIDKVTCPLWQVFLRQTAC
jgi:hypothetical protein